MGHPYTAGTLITPTPLLSRQLRRSYDAAKQKQGARVWESPDILSLGAWTRRVWRDYAASNPLEAPLLLSSVQADALWEKVIEASEGSQATALLDLPATVGAAVRAWDLLQQWEAQVAPEELADTADTAAFSAWKKTVERELRQNGWITSSQLPAAIAGRVAAGSLKIPGALKYTGFSMLTPAQRRLFKACSAVERAGEASSKIISAARVACDDAADEFGRAAVWARQILEANPAAQIGVAVLGLAEHAAAIERIFDDTLQPGLEFAGPGRKAFSISPAARLAEAPLVASALSMLQVRSGIDPAEAAALFPSPFLSLGRAEGGRLAAGLRRLGADQVSLDVDLVRRAFPAFAKLAETIAAAQRPSQWSVAFSKLLAAAGWPGKRDLSLTEAETFEEWTEMLSELASLDLILPRVDYGGALRRLRRIAWRRGQAAGASAQIAPVQIIELAETEHARFDALWVAGLHAGAWPVPARPHSFLPLSLQRSLGMPHSSPEHELDRARVITARFLGSASEVICSYPRRSGEESLQASPLIEPLAEMRPDETPPGTALRRMFAMNTVLETRSPDQAPPLAPGTLQRGGMNVLKNQSACPFRAFAIYRLNAREADESELGISAKERGNVAHKALELLWNELRTQKRLSESSQEEIAALISRCVSEALDGSLGSRQESASVARARLLEQARWERLLADWLDQEKLQKSFEVAGSEQSRVVEAGGLRLEIKIDRINRLADGSVAILDYKTSDKLDKKAWDGERPDEPQLPFYAVKSEVRPTAVHFAQLALGKVGPLGYEGADLIKQLARWEPVVENLGRDFLQGNATVNPKERTTCKFCHLASLCRISELGHDRDADAVGDSDE